MNLTHTQARLILYVSLAVLCIVSFLVLKPYIDPQGDSPSYIQAMEVIQGSPVSADFVPNRILTSSLGLSISIALGSVTGGLDSGWMVMNIALYFLFAVTFYKILLLLFRNEDVAILATLFLASNYVAVTFGLNYYMDIGGWVFYILSLYFLLLYSRNGKLRDLLLSALAIGIGGLFKEYAFLACVAIFVYLVATQWRSPKSLIKNGLVSACVALAPFGVITFVVLHTFNYTYATWFAFNHHYYVYASRLIEYVKALGSIYNFLAFLVLGGAYLVWKKREELMPDPNDRIFVAAVACSVSPILFWPAITQRILFITVPAAIIVVCFLFKRYDKRRYLFLLVLVVYVVVSFIMNSVILPGVNLPF